MKILFVYIIFILFILTQCTVKNPGVEEFASPRLSALAVSDTLFLGSISGNPISVKAEDPQGRGDINQVTCFVISNRVVSVMALLDDGKNGDIIPNDGLFYGLLTGLSFGSAAGRFRIGVTAVDAEGHASDTLFTDATVMEGQPNARPLLSEAAAPDTIRTDSLESVFFSVRATDPNGADDIREVSVRIQASWVTELVDPVFLRDDGIGGDAMPADGVFSAKADMRNVLKALGPHWVRFEAQDASGVRSVPIVLATTVVGVNGPPVLSDLAAPDAVSRQSTLPILLNVRANDPQGPADIRRVYFNTTKPDGTPSSGNPFLMVDDGTKGDQTAGDGIYSLAIVINTQNDLGVYRFEFFAEDASGAVSLPLVHPIAVTDLE